MKVVIKKAGQKAAVKEIDSDLKVFQKIVNGCIEIFPFVDDIVCVCNKDGKLLDLHPNFVIYNDYFIYGNVVYGDAFFTHKGNNDLESLSSNQVEFLINFLN